MSLILKHLTHTLVKPNTFCLLLSKHIRFNQWHRPTISPFLIMTNKMIAIVNNECGVCFWFKSIQDMNMNVNSPLVHARNDFQNVRYDFQNDTKFPLNVCIPTYSFYSPFPLSMCNHIPLPPFDITQKWQKRVKNASISTY